MLSTCLLSLRDGLEAALIIGIVLGTLSKIRRQDLKPAAWFGTFGAGAVSILAAVLLTSFGVSQEVLAYLSHLIIVSVLWMRSNIIPVKLTTAPSQTQA